MQFFEALSYSARAHAGQTRKSGNIPYINHPIAVVKNLTVAGILDDDVLCAAILHDTIEDTDATEADLAERFGTRIANIVMEVTDDKSLHLDERKRLCIEHAPHLSPEACLVKLADMTANVRDLTTAPPAGWASERLLDYARWAEAVARGCEGANPKLELGLKEAIAEVRAVHGSSTTSQVADRP